MRPLDTGQSSDCRWMLRRTLEPGGAISRNGYYALHLRPHLAQTGGWRAGRACPLCPGISDINLFRYCQSVIDLDAEIPDRAFDLGMPEQELDGP
jgi:hypothetical protein